MNFTDLYKKIYNLDTLTEASDINECGCMDNNEPQKQQDSLTMNVSINGQGSNGIRDLMDILRNIEKKDDNDGVEMQTSSPEPLKISSDDFSIPSEPEIITISNDVQDEKQDEDSELEPQFGDPDQMVLGSSEEQLADEFENSLKSGSNEHTLGVLSVIGMGQDLSSKGKGALKANGGENPWNVNETLVNHLKDLYQEVKKKSLNEGRDGNYNLPGPGDVETWPRDIKSKKTHGASRYHGHDDYAEPEYKQPERTDKPEIKWDPSKEGVAPNGEKYNSRLMVKASTNSDIEREIYLFDKYDRGAKKLVDVSKKETDNGIIGILYVVDNHKYGMWRPWKEKEPIAKPFSWD